MSASPPHTSATTPAPRDDTWPTVEPLPLRRGKRLFDIVCGLALIGVLAPVYVGAVLAMALDFLLVPADRGPWLYREPRIGRGQRFTIYKFRIIRQPEIDAAQAVAAAAGTSMSVKVLERQPALLTRSGRWLKAFYLDELPQLFNILLGDMTLVGPRPWPPPEYRAHFAQVGQTKGRVPCGLAGPVQGRKGQSIDYHQLERDYVTAYATKSTFGLILYDLGHIWGALRIMLQGKGL